MKRPQNTPPWGPPKLKRRENPTPPPKWSPEKHCRPQRRKNTTQLIAPAGETSRDQPFESGHLTSPPRLGT
ncbi:hypothetical protein RB8884 [Rhodopirellula baltica SH 1]|uniref:Uncharacterized protein n=1 Tax=Rhodopirellula baltica (strain DSM 10527 / NCIMB 13988 / SH1) TaxID=243090 RepID=Q7UME2_RHOBA|nr:hypothetical protein RB8884 [Rhodopirellula baltica SH 1]